MLADEHLLLRHSSLVVYFRSCIIFQKNTKCVMNSLNNGLTERICDFFKKIFSPAVIQLRFSAEIFVQYVKISSIFCLGMVNG